MSDHQDVAAAASRCAAHAKTLLDGAPHQQDLAQDLALLAGYVFTGQSSAASAISAQLATLRANVDNVLSERDDARRLLAETRQDHDEALKAWQVELDALKAQLLSLQSRYAAATGAHGAVSTEGETFADIKAKSKKS